MGERNRRVFSLLKEQNKTKAAMARELNISKSAISQWEKNETDPTYEQCQILSRFFNVSLDYLMNGKREMYEIFETLLQDRGLKAADVCRGTELPSSLFSEWKRGKSNPKIDKLQKIADYFGVPLNYFMIKETTPAALKVDEHNIEKQLETMLNQIDSDSELMLSGNPIDDEARELLKNCLEMTLKIAKILSKKANASKKYKK